MFWGWTDDLAAYKERKRKEKLAWDKKHPYRAKFNKFKDIISSILFFLCIVSWVLLLPFYGIYCLFT